MNKLTFTFALALIGAAVLNTSANAASQGDFILGFQVSSGTGSTLNFESDLGQYSNFTLIPGGTTVNLTAGLTTTGQTGAFSINDLVGTNGVFGSDPTIKGMITGVIPNDSVNSELFVTQKVATAPGSSPTNPAYQNIQLMANGFASGTALGTGTTDISIAKTTSGAYSDEAGTSGQFGQFSSTNSQDTYSNAGSVNFYLYDDPKGTTPTELGFFTLYGAGDTTDTAPGGGSLAGQLRYTSALTASPEPSTYALMGVGLLLAVVFRRRFSMMA
jgi:hypothetical protein